MQDDPAALADIGKKLDFLIAHDDMQLFDTKEVIVLQRIIAAWSAAEGFIRVTKYVGIVLAFIVLAWTQWDRLMELIQGAKT